MFAQVDGVVLSGRAVADEAMLTGEAALVSKQTGDRVSTLQHMFTATCACSCLVLIRGVVAGGTLIFYDNLKTEANHLPLL